MLSECFKLSFIMKGLRNPLWRLWQWWERNLTSQRGMLFNSFQVLGGKASAVAFDSRGRQQLARFPIKKKASQNWKNIFGNRQKYLCQDFKICYVRSERTKRAVGKTISIWCGKFHSERRKKKNNSQLSPPMRLSRNSIIWCQVKAWKNMFRKISVRRQWII